MSGLYEWGGGRMTSPLLNLELFSGTNQNPFFAWNMNYWPFPHRPVDTGIQILEEILTFYSCFFLSFSLSSA